MLSASNDSNYSMRQSGGLSPNAGLCGVCTIVSRVPSGVLKKNNPNLFSVGDGFGLFVFLGEFEEAHCRNGVAKQPGSKVREPRKKKQI